MSDRITGFLHGLTFYPFPCVVPHAYDGWSDRKMNWYGGGVCAFLAASLVGIGYLIWFG